VVLEPEVASTPNVISRRRSLRTLLKEGKGLARFRYVVSWSHFLIKPHRTFRTRVRSVTGSPRLRRASVMSFILRQ
jgi:hypothetical protein